MAKMILANPLLRVEGSDSSKGSSDPYDAQVAARQSEADKYQLSVASLTSQLRQVEQLKGQELLRALSQLQIPDSTIQKVLPLYQDSVASEASALQSGLGQNHPTVKSIRASKEVYATQLTDQVESIKHSLGIQLEIAQNTLATVQKQLADLRGEAKDSRSSSNAYNQVKEDYIKAQAILDAAEQSRNTKDIQNKMPVRPAIAWDKAEPATSPSSPKVVLNMALGVVIGLLVGIGLAFFIEYLDTSVKTMDDVEVMLGVPVLAIIPKNIKLLHKCPSDVPDAEAYRILRTNIEFNRKSADANTISMVSGGPGEGKSTTLANLAFTCAQGGYSVLIVDADLRRPTQHKIFEIGNQVGLTNFLTANTALEDVIVPTQIENLHLMPSGILPADAVGILNSQRMSDMIAELKTRYDIIFFDSPPILGVSDGAVLASEVDQSIIVVQHRRFPRALLQRVKQSVASVGGTVLGVVLNNVDLRHDPSYAYYTSYYDYYSARPAIEEQQVAAASTSKSVISGAAIPRNSSARDTEY
jgi:succinoglycan biosynthesis transport protein ExoP